MVNEKIQSCLQTAPSGLTIMHMSYAVREWHATGNVEFVSQCLQYAFNNCLPILISDWNMIEGYKDASAMKTFSENMGFETVKIFTFSKRFAPWNGADLYFLRSWSPGLNVSTLQLWSTMYDEKQQSQHLPFCKEKYIRYFKYDTKKYFEQNDTWDGEDYRCFPLSPMAKTHQTLTVDGVTYKFLEMPGYKFNNTYRTPYPIVIEKAPGIKE